MSERLSYSFFIFLFIANLARACTFGKSLNFMIYKDVNRALAYVCVCVLTFRTIYYQHLRIIPLCEYILRAKIQNGIVKKNKIIYKYRVQRLWEIKKTTNMFAHIINLRLGNGNPIQDAFHPIWLKTKLTLFASSKRKCTHLCTYVHSQLMSRACHCPDFVCAWKTSTRPNMGSVNSSGRHQWNKKSNGDGTTRLFYQISTFQLLIYYYFFWPKPWHSKTPFCIVSMRFHVIGIYIQWISSDSHAKVNNHISNNFSINL